MSDFKAKMHQIRYRRRAGGAYTALPQTGAYLLTYLLLSGGEGEGRGMGRKG